MKEPKRTGGSLDGSLTFGQPRFKLCRAGFIICWSVVVEPASGWWVYTRAANWWASVPISKNRPALWLNAYISGVIIVTIENRTYPTGRTGVSLSGSLTFD